MNLVAWIKKRLLGDDEDWTAVLSSPEQKRREEENLRRVQRVSDALRARARLQQDRE